jgi:hypothetical protein
MRHASQERSAPISTSFPAPPAQSPRVGGTSKREGQVISNGTRKVKSTEILLSPDGTFVSEAAAAVGQRAERRRQLAIAIRQRIESRLAGRIHDLTVRIDEKSIVLEGRCATYYSKQLAQHAALGILEDEHLENAIIVAVPR